MNWKKKAEELLNFVEYSAKNTDGKYSHINAMFEFAKLACEYQKRICAQKCSRYSGDSDLVINAPTVKFD